MVDRALAVINSARPGALSFDWFRGTLMADNGLKDTLSFGHAVIDTPDQLDQYLHTYGPMIRSQWENVASYLNEIQPPELVIDYGCGQGLGGLLANDLSRRALFSAALNVLLIEPSNVALSRALAIYRRIVPTAEVYGVEKRFDDVRNNDLPEPPDGSTLHIFSNSLDIKGFKPLKLLERTLRPGHHTILSVSHDRDFNGGTPQIKKVKAAVSHPSMASKITVRRSTLDPFTCDNPSESEAVKWFCELDVKDG